MPNKQAFIQTQIGHLLPNPQILNFHDGTAVLPPTTGTGLRLIMGAGDLNHRGQPNTRLFADYDVFLCEPWDWDHGSLLQNVEHILTTPGRLLCFLDVDNPSHVKKFTKLFANRFNFIDGYAGHCPHFDMQTINALLMNGGTATNLYENSENHIMKHELEAWIQDGYFKGGYHDDYITGRLGTLTAELHARFMEVILARQQGCRRIQIDEAFIRAADIRKLQHIARAQMFELSMPISLTGTFTEVQKSWREPRVDFVVKKRA